jgi:hypothetical protein
MVDKDRLVPVANAFYKLAHALQDVPKEELRKVHYPAKRFIAWLAANVANKRVHKRRNRMTLSYEAFRRIAGQLVISSQRCK